MILLVPQRDSLRAMPSVTQGPDQMNNYPEGEPAEPCSASCWWLPTRSCVHHGGAPPAANGVELALFGIDERPDSGGLAMQPLQARGREGSGQTVQVPPRTQL
jgi:hypothetical protein